jgi:hypothetical protein
MAAQKSAKVEWKGEDLKFHASVGSGYEFEMEGPATPQGGSPVEFLIAGAVGCSGGCGACNRVIHDQILLRKHHAQACRYGDHHRL